MRKDRKFGKGTSHPKAKLSAWKVTQILIMLKNCDKQTHIAAVMKVSEATITLIKQRKTWSHISKVFDIANPSN